MTKTLLSLTDSKRLEQLEKTISRGKETFIEVGSALQEIRDSKLYRHEFKTFEEYCRQRWGWNRAHAYRFIEAASVVTSLPENVSHGIQTERQARALAKVEPEKRAEVIEKAASTGKLTGASIAKAAGKTTNTSACGNEPDPAAEIIVELDDFWRARVSGQSPSVQTAVKRHFLKAWFGN